jgi:hypothetical protein
MGYSLNGAAFYYAAQVRRKKADQARKAAGKGSAFGDGLAVFLFAGVVALIGAVVHVFNYAMFYVSAFIDTLVSFLPFM